MSAGLTIFDFDGTLTDAEIEGKPFRDGYLEDLATLCGASSDDVEKIAQEVELRVLSQPGQFGWLQNGKIVAPASVDPYLRMMPIAREVLDSYDLFTEPESRSRLLEGVLFKHNYRNTATAFRPQTAAVLSAMREKTVAIVTNSHTDAVLNKLSKLEGQHGEFDWLKPNVFGYARKYILGDEPKELPESWNIPGLQRLLYLRRPKYFEVLHQVATEQGVKFNDVLVIGDIFELDLAVPLALGARVILVASKYTPQYEIDFLSKHDRGQVCQDLGEVADLLDISL